MMSERDVLSSWCLRHSEHNGARQRNLEFAWREFSGFYGRCAYEAFDGGRTGSEDERADSPAAPSTESRAHVNNPAETVKRMFAAFGARDLDTLLETVHPESRWTCVGANPQLGRAEFTGRTQVRTFFERLLERLQIAAFNTDQFVVEGNTVVVFGSESGTVRARSSPSEMNGPRSMW